MSAFFGIVGLVGMVGFLINSIVMAIKKYPKKKQWGSTIGVIFFAIMFFIGTSTSQSNPSTVAQAAVTSSSISGIQSSNSSAGDNVMTVDYKTLYSDYEDNPINADSKYRDKKLQLTGTISNIDRDISKKPYITFYVDEYGSKSIKMSFNNDETVAALKKGQNVKVVGTCGGTFASTIVVLNNCKIVD